jgi:hypothetical protein
MQAGNWRPRPRHAFEHYISNVNLSVSTSWKFWVVYTLSFAARNGNIRMGRVSHVPSAPVAAVGGSKFWCNQMEKKTVDLGQFQDVVPLQTFELCLRLRRDRALASLESSSWESRDLVRHAGVPNSRERVLYAGESKTETGDTLPW